MMLGTSAMNRSLNRENPDILFVMIAEKQIMRGERRTKEIREKERKERERERDGPFQKPATEMSGTAPPKAVVMFLSLYISIYIYLFLFLLLCGSSSLTILFNGSISFIFTSSLLLAF
ncbi:hypothetical protein L1049_018486 [Liquidambar formosana]|uniref:Uncharacterized protein n=1 Tax=Liquidambar formosana TaxID=63359 RepID=A0AAP0RAP0_LIQFO